MLNASMQPNGMQPENDEAAENAKMARMYDIHQNHTREQIMQKLADAGVDFNPSERKSDLVSKLHDVHFPEGATGGAEAKPVAGISVTKVTAMPTNGAKGTGAAISKLPNIAAAFGLPVGGAMQADDRPDYNNKPAVKPMPPQQRFGALAQALGLR